MPGVSWGSAVGRDGPLLGILIATVVLTSTAVIAYGGDLRDAVGHYRRPAGDRVLVFDDEFHGGELSSRRWTTCYWWDRGDGCTNEGNDEQQWYLPGQVVVTGGRAVLQARAEPVALGDGRTFPHRSGMLTTGRDTSDLSASPRFAFTYGHLEVRARLPAGRGLWPAVWLLPADHVSRPEIDVVEVLGDSPTVLRMHVHHVDGAGERRSLGRDRRGPDLSAGFHTFGLTWTPAQLTFWLDGTRLWEVVEPDAIPHEPMYLLINLAVGGEWPGPPDRDSLPADLEVEHVRIWQEGPR